MDLNLKGKSVVVTGGGTGIGKAIAKEFAREGANVSICGRRLEKLHAVKAELQSEGLDCDCYQADVSVIEDIQKLADGVAEKAGSVDIWINNAGVGKSNHVLDYTKEEYDYVMRINLGSVYEGCRIAARQMIKQGAGGVIINASSFASLMPSAGGAIYAASKAAINSFTKSFAAELAPYGIRVCGYIPGVVSTEINAGFIETKIKINIPHIALRRIGEPADIAKPVVILASEACSYITGFSVEISGGKFVIQNCEQAWVTTGKI